MKRSFIPLTFLGLFAARSALGQPVGAPLEPAAPAPQPAAPAPQPAAPAAPQPAAPAAPQPAAPAAPQPAAPAPQPAAPALDAFAAPQLAENELPGGVMVGEEPPKLEFYGFADFSYMHPLMGQDNILTHYVGPYSRFYVGHLNLYMSSTLGENWRTLSEVRFTYSPAGDEGVNGEPAADGSFPRLDTTVEDYGEAGRSFSWGGIELQRAWIEYQPLDFLSIRGGLWLTPYGYWNDDHGSPTIIAAHKPFPVGEAFFPEHQTGLMVHGKYFVGFEALGYALTLSNGRGPFDSFRDLDSNKALGARLYFESSRLGNFTFGVDAYRGRSTTSTKRFRIEETETGEPKAMIYRTIDAAFDELSLGADFRWLWGGLHLQGEVMMNEAAFDPESRPLTQGFDPRPSFMADYRRIGGYLLAGYRTDLVGLMPYVMGEYSSYDNSDFSPPVWAGSVGVNLRPTPSVVLKVEVAYAEFVGLGSTGFGEDDLTYGGAQVAWAF